MTSVRRAISIVLQRILMAALTVSALVSALAVPVLPCFETIYRLCLSCPIVIHIWVGMSVIQKAACRQQLVYWFFQVSRLL